MRFSGLSRVLFLVFLGLVASCFGMLSFEARLAGGDRKLTVNSLNTEDECNLPDGDGSVCSFYQAYSDAQTKRPPLADLIDFLPSTPDPEPIIDFVVPNAAGLAPASRDKRAVTISIVTVARYPWERDRVAVAHEVSGIGWQSVPVPTTIARVDGVLFGVGGPNQLIGIENIEVPRGANNPIGRSSNVDCRLGRFENQRSGRAAQARSAWRRQSSRISG